jgi:hypothetical protein
MKFVETNPISDPDIAARKLVEIASTVEPGQEGRIYIELVNHPSSMPVPRRASFVPRWPVRLSWAGSGVTKAAPS